MSRRVPRKASGAGFSMRPRVYFPAMAGLVGGVTELNKLTVYTTGNLEKHQQGWGFGGREHERLYRKPLIYNPSPNRQAPQGTSKS